MSKTKSKIQNAFIDSSFDESSYASDDSENTDNTENIPKRRRSVIEGCACDLDALPERFVLYKVEKELGTLLKKYENIKFYDLEKHDWLKFKRTLKDITNQIKQLKDK